jgi:LytS/YehU family sensor histidine kinase
VTYVGETIAKLILYLLFPGRDEGILPTWQSALFTQTLTFTIGFGAFLYETSQSRLRQKALEEERARALATEARLASLESRIHPHFLFNTLNSISALIDENPVVAGEMMENLSDLLRYSLDSNSRNLVALEQELGITKKYLAIEKMRYEERLDFQIDCDDSMLSAKVPPLSLQTVVENSIKHVVAKTSEKTTIAIAAVPAGDFIEIEVRDGGPGFDDGDIIVGHGLDTLWKRLQVSLGEKAKMEFGDDGSVKLRLPRYL